MAVSNSAWKSKLSYEDIRDLILSKEVRRKESSETSRQEVEYKTRTLAGTYQNPEMIEASLDLNDS
jgi:hypothetical protein